jgi:hypothetical protein
MDSNHFDEPVKILFGKPGQIRVVSSAREAGECLASSKWPIKSKRKHLAVQRAMAATLEGKQLPLPARKAFEALAKDVDILV